MKKIDPRLLVMVCLLAVGAGWVLNTRAAPPAPGLTPERLGLQLPPVNVGDLDLAVTARARANTGVWLYPGVSNLQPKVFGTVAEPLGEEFAIGVPLYDRLDDGQGNWTTTALPGIASNVTAPIVGVARVRVRDRTPVDLASFTDATQDQLDCRITFQDPFGRQIEVTSTQPLPKGPFHEFFGGVATNVFLHGRTGCGAKLLPQTFAYLATWSLAEVRIDGTLLPGNDNRLLHTMITHGIRDPNNDPGVAGGNGPFLGTDAEVDRNDLEFHMVLPPVRFLPNPQPNTPVVGFPQDFVHLIFENVRLSGSSLNGVIQR